MFKKVFLALMLMCGPLAAQEKTFALQAPDDLVETEFLQYLLPRFSLKTGIRISVQSTPGDAAFGDDGTAVFRDEDRVWYLSTDGGPHTTRFQEWLLSDVGSRTIEGFAPDGTTLFSADVSTRRETAVREITGDVALGETVSMSQCGRCHVVNDSNRMNAIGSTPSFALMRNFDDWEGRFQSFFALKPHGAFTQVEDVTDPFPDNLPSPIAPITVTLEEIEAIVAYVATIPPADLGAPVQSR